nr:hypothetical protein REQ54_01616 [Rhizobium sp. Q54]
MNRETFDWAFREFIRFLFRPKGFEGRVAAGWSAPRFAGHVG